MKKGLCSKPWAAAKCPKTCNTCDEDDEDNEGEVCKDHSWPKHCENILKNGHCSRPWLAAKCPKTCGLCGDDGKHKSNYIFVINIIILGEIGSTWNINEQMFFFKF